MAEENSGDTTEPAEETAEEPKKKLSLKLSMPNPIFFLFVGPAVLIFGTYLVLSNVFLSDDLIHEEKLELVLTEEDSQYDGNGDNTATLEEDLSADTTEGGGFLTTHNYFQFPVAFAVNIPNSKKHLTFELAVSTFQTGVGAEWFFDSFNAFVPAIRSDILYFMGSQSLRDLQSDEYQKKLLIELREVINKKLEDLGAKPEVNKVLFLRYIIT